MDKTATENRFQRGSINEGLYGLVLAGGRGVRMKADKSLLRYHDKSQVEYCYDLLLPLCKRVLVSNRSEQADLKEHEGLSQIHDIFPNIGPLGGILSAMTQYPKVSWLVLACDLPFVTERAIKALVDRPLIVAGCCCGYPG